MLFSSFFPSFSYYVNTYVLLYVVYMDTMQNYMWVMTLADGLVGWIDHMEVNADGLRYIRHRDTEKLRDKEARQTDTECVTR